MERNLPHIKGPQPAEKMKFTTVQSGGFGPRFPDRDRSRHGKQIKRKLERVWQESEVAVSHTTRKGIYIEFLSAPGSDLTIKSLENLRKGIRICNVRQEGSDKSDSTSYITIFVPNEQKQVFFDKIEAYLTEETKGGKPKNKNLIEKIEDIRKAFGVEFFWTDEKELIPDGHTQEWCEIWLRDEKEDEDAEQKFNDVLDKLEIERKPGSIKFPERIVKLILASRQNLSDLTKHSGNIAEYRKAKSTADFLLSETPREQSEWVENLNERITIDNTSNVAICLLDTGVNNGHPLIAPILSSNDCHAINPKWKTNDHNKHGTLMSGILGYGNLQEHLVSSNKVTIKHRLESVKILPPNGRNPVDIWGDITKQGISKAEIQGGKRKRIICMPVSAEDTRDRGRPSSWSAAIDQVTSGAEDGERRLMIVATGNSDPQNWRNYPNANLTDPVHDPAQSWNALAVGAITNLQNITDPSLNSYNPLAKAGELSPFTTTSITWDDKWPFKPDVVFEGGNLAMNNSNFTTECNDLSLVSTFYKPTEQLLYPFNMTSAAAAQAANFAARIQSEYPDYWPETIRALMVHSARWPDAVKSQVTKNKNKTELKKILQSCGYGKPNLEQALHCAHNSLTLITEAEIQPFEKDGSSYKTKDMHLYDFPWPKDILEDLGEAEIEMRITLSYFVEPGPGEIGWKDRYRYASHALRFDLNSPAEDKATFMKRINKNSREDDEQSPSSQGSSNRWLIGVNNRNIGSIHSDIWHGTAVDLASSNLIAVFPIIGWWRERQHLKKYNQNTRYSLIVSISTPENDVDIYTPVKVSISQPITIPA